MAYIKRYAAAYGRELFSKLLSKAAGFELIEFGNRVQDAEKANGPVLKEDEGQG